MRVDLVDRGPRNTPRDPIRSLAYALGAAGHSVRLFSPSPPEETGPGVQLLRLAVPAGGAARGGPALGRALGTLLDPAAVTVLPFEFAGLKGAPTHPLLTSLPPVDAAPLERATGWLDRFFGGRAARRAEATAIARSRWVLAPGDEERRRFLAAAPPMGPQAPVLPPVVPLGPDTPDRASARRALHLPDDVPVIAYLGPRGDAPSIALVREAFQRVRVFFPGARLLLPGIAAPTEPGTHALPPIDPGTRSTAARASDLLVAPSITDPTELLAHARRGAPAVVGADVRWPLDPPKGSFRTPETPDAGGLASQLAELLADPALRRSLGEAGRAYADRYAPEAIVAQFATLAGG